MVLHVFGRRRRGRFWAAHNPNLEVEGVLEAELEPHDEPEPERDMEAENLAAEPEPDINNEPPAHELNGVPNGEPQHPMDQADQAEPPPIEVNNAAEPNDVPQQYIFQVDEVPERKACWICFEVVGRCVLQPCKHSGLCVTCAQSLEPFICPLCRKVIEEVFVVGRH